MSLRSSLKGLEAQVKRLEAASGKGRRNCPNCRLHHDARWPNTSGRGRASKDVVMAVCELCHSDYPTSLKGIPDDEREIYILLASASWEDYYTDPKIHAAYVWTDYRPGREDASSQRTTEKDGAKKGPSARRRAKLEAECDRIVERIFKRLRVKYGEDPFPEHTVLVDSIVNREGRQPDVFVPRLVGLEQEETCHLVRAALEKIIVGATRPETAAALESVRARIDAAVSAAREEKRLAEERRAQQDEAWRRQSEGYRQRTAKRT
jgi:hypothetical protein